MLILILNRLALRARYVRYAHISAPHNQSLPHSCPPTGGANPGAKPLELGLLNSCKPPLPVKQISFRKMPPLLTWNH